MKRKQVEQNRRMNDSEQKRQETNLDKMREELQHFKKAFQEIKNVTGVGDVNDVSEIIQKFMTQDDTLNGLKTIKNEKSRRLEELNMEREKLKEKVNKYKYEGAEGVSKKQAEEIEKNIGVANGKLESCMHKYARINQTLVDVQSGIDHLYENTKLLKVTSLLRNRLRINL
jgi:antitoxin component YwqK of YwqJK toxin-antitoxin module